MNYFLLKRNPEIGGRLGKKLSSKGSHWYVNTRNGGAPAHSKILSKGDLVYLCEKGYGIWGKGEVRDVRFTDKPLKSLKDFLHYVDQSNLKNQAYWGQLFLNDVRRHLENKTLQMFLCEFLLDQETLDTPIITHDFKGQNSFQMLTGPMDDYESKATLGWDVAIPTSLRFRVYMHYQVYLKSFIFDLDHVVPASIGGPGNIEENLYPLTSSVNRTKGDSIPDGLFFVAQKSRDLFPSLSNCTLKILRCSSSDFVPGKFRRDPASKEAARELLSRLKERGICREVKEFFAEVKNFQYPISGCDNCGRKFVK